MHPMSSSHRVLVVGAGAAGLWAAERAARAQAQAGFAVDVVVLEKTGRTGTKVLASGGTHCNLTTTLEPDEAVKLFGSAAERFLLPAFWNLSPRALRARFHELGVETVEAPLEKVFPKSGKARDVRDALDRAAQAAGVRFEFDVHVAGVEREGESWRVRAEDGREFGAERLILCPGGQSYPKSGTTGDGYGWCRSLGLRLVEPVPALVPLVSSESWPAELAGVSPQDVEVRLLSSAGKVVARRRRPVVFTHRGLSGPGAMDVSEAVARYRAEGSLGAPPRVALDLMPDIERDELRDLLIEGAGARGAPRVSRLLPVPVAKSLRARIAVQAGLPEADPRAGELGKGTRHGLVEALKGLFVSVSDTEGWHKAEVTAGGVDLRQIDPDTYRVRGLPGLYIIGELLDLQGPIGGLNFQAAWAAAELAGADAGGV